MCLYSAKEISQIIGCSERTFYRRLAVAKKKKFKKKSEGQYYTPEEVVLFASKIGIKITLPIPA